MRGKKRGGVQEGNVAKGVIRRKSCGCLVSRVDLYVWSMCLRIVSGCESGASFRDERRFWGLRRRGEEEFFLGCGCGCDSMCMWGVAKGKEESKNKSKSGEKSVKCSVTKSNRSRAPRRPRVCDCVSAHSIIIRALLFLLLRPTRHHHLQHQPATGILPLLHERKRILGVVQG